MGVSEVAEGKVVYFYLPEEASELEPELVQRVDSKRERQGEDNPGLRFNSRMRSMTARLYLDCKIVEVVEWQFKPGDRLRRASKPRW